MKHLIRKIIPIIVVILFGFTADINAAQSNSSERIVRVAFPESRGISETYEDGTYGGAFYDWLIEISKYTGWTYEFIPCTVNELIPGKISFDYDLLGGVLYQPEFEEYLNYPKYVMGSNYSLLIYRKDNQSIKSFDLSTIDGKTIGVYSKANKKIDRLNLFLSANRLNCNLKYYDNSSDYNKSLENREVDLLLGSDIYSSKDYNVAAKFEADSYYIAANSKKEELHKELNDAIIKIYEANPNFANELYDKYFTTNYINSICISDEDWEFIKSSSPIRVAVVDDNYPLYYESDNKNVGIVPDIFELIKQRTGLTFKYIAAENYQASIDLVKNGEADILACFLDDDGFASTLDLSLTKQYASLDTVILRNSRVDLQSGNLTIAVPEGYDVPDDGIHDKVVYYKSYSECLRAVDSGSADYTQIMSAFVEELFLNDFYSNVVLSSSDKLETNINIAFAKPVNSKLYSIINKAINNITENEINSLLARNLVSAGRMQPSLKATLYSNPIAAIVIFAVFLILITIIILLSGYFHLKSKEMKLKLENIESVSRSKSEFFSRISHEIRTPLNAILGLTTLTQMTEDINAATRSNLEKINSSAQFLLSLVNDVLDMAKIEKCKMRIYSMPFSMSRLINQLESIFAVQAELKNIKLSFNLKCENTFVGDEIRIKQILANLLSNACKFTEYGGQIDCSIVEYAVNNEYSDIYFQVTDNGIGIPKEDLNRIFESFEQVNNCKPNNISGTGLGLAISSNLVRLMDGELKVYSKLGDGTAFFFTIRLPIYQDVIKETEANNDESISFNKLRILLAEDNDLNAEITASLLKMQGIESDRALNGKEAVEMFSSSAPGYYDIILMDIRMPVMDGLEAAKLIRNMKREDAEAVPIIAMTANTFQEDKDNALAAGMTGFIPKPFNVKQLFNTIRELK